MTNLMQASRQWSTRPPEERFTSLPAMREKLEELRAYSSAKVISSRQLSAIPTDDNQGIMIAGPSGHAAAPSNWAFGQLANLSGAPGAYLRTLPAPLAAALEAFAASLPPGSFLRHHVVGDIGRAVTL